MIVIVMGVSGVGKTTVGEALAARLGRPFLDADAFHTPASLAAMAAGRPLDDAARGPWIARMHQALVTANRRGEEPVLACSALKAVHRRALVAGLAPVLWLHLVAPPGVVADRLRRRHRARPSTVGPDLLASQLRSIEAPVADLGPVVEVDATAGTDAVVEAAVGAVRAAEVAPDG